MALLVTGAFGLVWNTQSSFGLASGTENRVVNGGAENGETAPWIASGWDVDRYGSTATPESEFAELWQFGALGSYLFAAREPGATLEQNMSLEDLVEPIEAGTQLLYFELMLGGQSDGGSATASVTFLGADAHQVGSPVQLGPIAAADLTMQPALLSCEATLNVPTGSRTAKVAIDGATGPPGALAYGIADNIYLSTAHAAGADRGGRYTAYPSSTPNCYKPALVPWPPIPPLPTTAGTPSDGPATSSAKLQLRQVAARRASVSVEIACVGTVGSTCEGRFGLMTAEPRRAHRAVTSAQVGSASVAVHAGAQTTIHIHLTAAGYRRLRALHRLRVILDAFSADGSEQSLIAKRVLTLVSR